MTRCDEFSVMDLPSHMEVRLLEARIDGEWKVGCLLVFGDNMYRRSATKEWSTGGAYL